MSITLLVTKTFECPNLMTEDDFETVYGSDPVKLWKYFTDADEDVFDFCQDSGQVIRVEAQVEKSAFDKSEEVAEKELQNRYKDVKPGSLDMMGL